MILKEAQVLTGADAGSIYLVDGNKLIFKTSRSNFLFKKYGEAKVRADFKSFEMPINKNSISGYVALTKHSLNLPDVKNLPKGSDFGYDASYDKKQGYDTVSMLVIPMLNREKDIIGVLQLINCMDNEKKVPFTTEHEKITSAFSSQAAVAIQNVKLAEQLKQAHFDTIFRLSVAAEYRDKETSNHIKRVSYYSRLIAENCGCTKEECELIFWSAPMHDIGKLGIPDAILHKPGPLTPEEREIMEQHAAIGALILKGSEIPVIKRSMIVALTHHEKYDGTGYPQKLKGEEIPYEGRIVALADVFDALTSKRIYKPPMEEAKVISILKEGRGTHFDPQYIDILLSKMDEVRAIKEKYDDKPEDLDKYKDLKTANLREMLK
jgi:putative two-component system response regulator